MWGLLAEVLGGHTYIYVGPQAGGYNEASASLGDRSANLAFLNSPTPMLWEILS